MDLSFLDKSSGVTPLLVRLYDSHKLYGLAKDKKPIARGELVSAVTELLDMDLSPREGELVADVLIGLVRQAEHDLRMALAEQLSTMDNAPLRLVLHMANDEIDVARPILRHSTVLSDQDLVYIIKSKDGSYWREIAQRQELGDGVVTMLAETRDFNTALALAENRNIRLTENAVTVLADLARGQDMLAQPLLRRTEVPPSIAKTLYQYVGQEIKQYILENFELDRSQLIEAVDDIVIDMQASAAMGDIMPQASMMKSAERFKSKGLLTLNLMLSTLKRGQTQAFVAQMACYTSLPPQIVAEMIMQPSGQGLAVACKAFDIQKPDFISMYLLTNRVRAKEKMIQSNEILRAIKYFERIDAKVARDIVANSLKKT